MESDYAIREGISYMQCCVLSMQHILEVLADMSKNCEQPLENLTLNRMNKYYTYMNMVLNVRVVS